MNNFNNDSIRPVRLLIDLDALAWNLGEVRRLTAPGAAFCCSLKANAYGHGAVAVARAFRSFGADRFSVAILDEGIELREAGIDAPVLVLGLPEYGRADEAVAYGLTQTVASYEDAKPLSDAAERRGVKAAVHVKVDTGMGRIGIACVGSASEDYVGAPSGGRAAEESAHGCVPAAADVSAAIEQVLAIAGLPGIYVEGIYTHFASSDDVDPEYTRVQFAAFSMLLDGLSRRGLVIPVRHCANSAAVVGFPHYHLDMVRPGIMLYGGAGGLPGAHHRFAELKPVMSLTARVSFVKRIGAGMSVGYSRSFIAKRDSVIATLPLGYGDGYARALSRGRGEALIAGRRAPVAGNICMDQCMVDVTDIGNVNPGDTAVLIGRQDDCEITAADIADKLGTIAYEVMCGFDRRVPRVYMSGGRAVSVDSINRAARQSVSCR